MQSLSEFGHHYVDAPVSGGPKGAREGTLTSMVGGDHEVVEKVSSQTCANLHIIN